MTSLSIDTMRFEVAPRLPGMPVTTHPRGISSSSPPEASLLKRKGPIFSSFLQRFRNIRTPEEVPKKKRAILTLLRRRRLLSSGRGPVELAIGGETEKITRRTKNGHGGQRPTGWRMKEEEEEEEHIFPPPRPVCLCCAERGPQPADPLATAHRHFEEDDRARRRRRRLIFTHWSIHGTAPWPATSFTIRTRHGGRHLPLL